MSVQLVFYNCGPNKNQVLRQNNNRQNQAWHTSKQMPGHVKCTWILMFKAPWLKGLQAPIRSFQISTMSLGLYLWQSLQMVQFSASFLCPIARRANLGSLKEHMVHIKFGFTQIQALAIKSGDDLIEIAYDPFTVDTFISARWGDQLSDPNRQVMMDDFKTFCPGQLKHVKNLFSEFDYYCETFSPVTMFEATCSCIAGQHLSALPAQSEAHVVSRHWMFQTKMLKQVHDIGPGRHICGDGG